MLKKIRIGLAIVFFSSITILFLDFTGVLQKFLGFTIKTQFLPALMALNIIVVASITLATFVFGRVYCSVICPLGVFQDIISKFGAKLKKNRFKYSPPKTKTRLIIFSITLISIICGFSFTTILIDPYALYGRIASSLFSPFYRFVNNLLSIFADNYNIYEINYVNIKQPELLTLSISIVSLVVIMALALRNGRTYCNTICPVGSLLGYISKFSLLKHEIELEHCNSCGLCSKNCKASCINSQDHKIDYSRCVSCYDCIGNCRRGAINYKFSIKSSITNKTKTITKDVEPEKENANARRAFISFASMFALSQFVKSQTIKVDGGFADIVEKIPSTKGTSLVPPGASSIANLSKNCTACQLCVSNCPNNVLKAETNVSNLMQPRMTFEKGYCRPECVKCSDACPTGAIKKISNIEKSAIKIGTAVWIKEKCLGYSDSVKCNNCMRHCPTGAIQIVSQSPNDAKSPQLVVINNDRCIGCGACENLCPVRPLSAIYVEGCEVHRTI